MAKIPLKDYQNAKKLSTDVFAVGPTFSSFAVVTHKKSVVLYCGSTFRLRITIKIFL